MAELPTRCDPWTVRDLTAHLAVTFKRFAQMLERSRAGDLSPPFARRELSDENLRAVAVFSGDPYAELRRWAEGFVAAVGDDDLEDARGGRYQPRAAVVQALVPVWERVLGGLPPGADDWARILAASGR